jgi:two-component system CheB/CheR fusion protein
MVPLTGGIAAAAALASLAVHAVRAWLTEDRFRRHQREVLGAAQGRIDNLADLMHEVRSPLGLISLNAGLIGRGVIDGAKAAALSETIQSRCRSIAAMLDDTLDLERIEAGLMPVHRRPCDLRTLVAAELDGVRVQAREYGIELTGPAATRTADVDPAALARILANLLNNALRFTPAGGRVGVSIEEGGAGGTIVAVRDTGTGIPAETRADLFRRFAVPGVPLNGRRGSGLGLSISISMALARSMGGELALGDTGEGGTRIEIRLPGARSGRG